MARIAIIGVPSPEKAPLLAKTPLLLEPVLLLPRSLLLLLLSSLLRHPRPCLFSLMHLFERVLPFVHLLLQPSRLGGHMGFLLGPQLGLFGLAFLLFGCRNLGV